MAVQRDALVGVLRIPLDSISHRWAASGLAAHATLTLAGLGWSIQHEITTGAHETAYGLASAIGIGLLWSFGVSTATVVTTAEVIDTVMVIAHFVGKKMKAEGIAQGRDEGIVLGRDEGIAQGRDEGIAQGRDEGIAQGRDEGIAQGRDEGRAETVAEMNAKIIQLMEAHPELKDTLRLLLVRDEQQSAD